MSDEARFETVANGFIQRLELRGLRPARFRQREADSDGWWTFAASWPGQRRGQAAMPRISVIFDRSLGEAQRYFWFGFESAQRGIVEHLVQEIGLTFRPYALYDYSNAPSDDQYRDAVIRSAGLAHELCDTDEHYFGKYEVGFSASSDEALVEQAAHFISQVVETYDPRVAEERDISGIEDADGLTPTERLALIMARRGQGKFRTDLLNYWKGFAVSGCATTEVLRASHIQPWRVSANNERVDPDNGLLLTATFDCLFDRGLISFGEDGRILISSKVSQEEAARIGLRADIRLRNVPSVGRAGYLAMHRKLTFKGDAPHR